MRRLRGQRRHSSTPPRSRAAASLGAGIGAFLTLAVVIAVMVSHTTNDSARYFQSNTGSSLVAQGGLTVGEIYDFGVPFNTTIHDQKIATRPVALPKGLPAHVRILHEVIATDGTIIGDLGWPVGSGVPAKQRQGPLLTTYTLDGYQLSPATSSATQPTVILVLVADAPGIYTIGPVTIRADSPGILGTPLGAASIEVTYIQYAVMCVEVSASDCDTAGKTIPTL